MKKYLSYIILTLAALSVLIPAIGITQTSRNVVGTNVTSSVATSFKAQVIGNGTAGSPDGNPVTIQGISGGYPTAITFTGPALIYQVGLPAYTTPFAIGFATSAGVFTLAQTNSTTAVTTTVDVTSISLNNKCGSAVSFAMTDGNNVPYSSPSSSIAVGSAGAWAIYPPPGQIFAGGIKVSAGTANCLVMQVNGWVAP